MEVQQGQQWLQQEQEQHQEENQKEEALLLELLLAVAGEELQVWAALAVGAGPELKELRVAAAWGAAWVTEPVVSLQEVVLRVEVLRKELKLTLTVLW